MVLNLYSKREPLFSWLSEYFVKQIQSNSVYSLCMKHLWMFVVFEVLTAMTM
jgi:hypothetical protein